MLIHREMTVKNNSTIVQPLLQHLMRIVQATSVSLLELSKRAGPYGPARLARLILGLGP